MKRTRALAAVAVALLLAVRVGGQTPPQQGPPPSFKAITSLVEVDAIVKDRTGKFVPDLTRDDFEVLEDGARQQVEQIYVVVGRDVKTVAAPAPPALAAPPAPPAPQTQRTFVLLFDQDNMLPGEVDRARKAAQEFLKNDFHDGDIGGVVNGATMINNRLTNVRVELEGAVSGIRPTGTARSLQQAMREWPRLMDSFEVYQIAERNDRETTTRAVQRACADDKTLCNEADQAVNLKARQLVVDFRRTGQQMMRTVAALANAMAKLGGRKTIILLSDGFFVEDTWADLRHVVDLANRASVRVYAIDTRGLNRGSASSDILDMGPHASVNPAAEVPGFETMSDGPNSLAVDTGGMVIRNENDFAKALTEIASDTSSYYILGYRSTNTKFDGKFRQITVRVKKGGVNVRARKGYLATAPAVSPPVTPPAAAERPAAVEPAVPAPAAPVVAAPPAAANAGPPTEPATAGTNAPASPLRLQPDVKDRLAALGKISPEAGRTGANVLPENLLAQARAGWKAYQKGDVKGAKVALSVAAAHPAAPVWVHYTLGWAQYALGEYAAAGNEWERVRTAAPEFEAVYFDLADSHLQQRDFGRALEVLRAAEKRWPKDVEIYNAIGVVQVGRGALNAAIETFETAVSLNPNDATGCYNLAKASELRYVQSQRLGALRGGGVNAVFEDRDRAIEYYQRTVAIGKEFVEEAKGELKRLGVQ